MNCRALQAAEKLMLCIRAWLQPCRSEILSVPALAAAKSQMIETKLQGLKPDYLAMLLRHD
jgi:hypothetical protein